MGDHEVYQQDGVRKDLLQELGFGWMTFGRVEGSKELTLDQMPSESGGSAMIRHLNASWGEGEQTRVRIEL